MRDNETRIEVETSFGLMELIDALAFTLLGVCACSLILFFLFCIAGKSEACVNFFLCLSLLSIMSVMVCGFFSCRESYKILCHKHKTDEKLGMDFEIYKKEKDGE